MSLEVGSIEEAGSIAFDIGTAEETCNTTEKEEGLSVSSQSIASFNARQERLRTESNSNASKIQALSNTRNQELFDVLVKYGQYPIDEAVKAGDKRAIEVMLNNGMSFLGSPGYPYPLSTALFYDNLDMALFLIDKGYPVDNVPPGCSLLQPLFLAIFYCARKPENIKLVEKLLANGANPNQQITAQISSPRNFADSILTRNRVKAGWYSC